MPTQPHSYDWAAMISDLQRLGLSEHAIGRAMASCLTRRMIELYRRGAQPLYWRGKMLLEFWCAETGRTENQAPTCEIIRGHRTQRRTITPTPRVQELPQWPPIAAPQRKVISLKKREKAVA